PPEDTDDPQRTPTTPRGHRPLGDEDSEIEDGDVVVPKSHVRKRNADPCVIKGCKWPRSEDMKVYVPYVIANNYCEYYSETHIIDPTAFFANSTCIRFVPRNEEQDYLYIHSFNGYDCRSYVGRKGNRQELFLEKDGCIVASVIQHELLHALGFQHEQKRSDRDEYIKMLWENIIKGTTANTTKTLTLNLETPYDYNSVMHYRGKYCHSLPSTDFMFPAMGMSYWDIERVNRLYCR
uniref:Metalloendopeptidase n=1 Tax=Neogobius melanostomus TaxID=47308 RepID=A0A8C6WLL6_9GOBI